MNIIKYLVLIIGCVLIYGCKEDSPVQPEEPLGYTSVGTPAQSLAEFENVLERIRTDLKIPGISADRKSVV